MWILILLVGTHVMQTEVSPPYSCPKLAIQAVDSGYARAAACAYKEASK